ncbi:MAG: TolC family protein, partial [Candidatus Sumerlaeota bacterium]|nr:TolC family protein [Candidatus Sumerlaeota bacterium]
IAARGAAETLAQLERRPDFSVGGKAQYQLSPKAFMPDLTLGMTLPINRARIRAVIAESLAARQAAEARYRSAESDTLARLVTALVLGRDASRIIAEYENDILPKARELYDTQIRTYGQGGGDLLSNLDTERTIVELRKAPLQAKADRLRFFSEIEEILAQDIFQFENTMSTNK